MTKREWLWIAAKATGITAVTAWLYYRSLWAVILLFPLWIWHWRLMVREEYRKKESDFAQQFKEAILTLSSSLNTGYSVENAFRETQKEMRLIYPEKARISKELQIIVRQLRLQVTVEQVLEEFAGRVELEDLRSFASVFISAKRSGGDMLAIIKDTAGQISDKIDVKKEIEATLAAKKSEQMIMSLMPAGIILYLQLASPGFLDILYGNPFGICAMTVCLAVYGAAYWMGKRIVEIEV